MNNVTNNVSTPALNQPNSATLTKRRVNFYFAKPKGKTVTETMTSNLIAAGELRSQIKSSSSLKETLICTDPNKTNQSKTTNIFKNDKTPRWKCYETEAKTEGDSCPAAHNLTEADDEENQFINSNKTAQYDVKLDKNFDMKVNALITEIDSRGPILLRNSFLCEDPIAWHRNPPFSKTSPKRSLSISSANFLQFDDASEIGRAKKKDFLEFPDPNVAFLVAINYESDMRVLSKLLSSNTSTNSKTYETDSDCDIGVFNKKSKLF